jgi:hypothetical protein
MNTYFFRITLIILLAFSLLSCRKENDNTVLTDTTFQNDPAAVYVNGRLMGIVSTENGQPVSGAVVKVGNNQTTSNNEGMFVFNNVSMNKNGTFVHVSHSGFWQASRKVYPHLNGTHHTHLVLMPKENAGQFDAATGGNINLSAGLELTFAANAVADLNNQPYSGNTAVAARWLNPLDENTKDMMPGDLAGRNASGQRVAIMNYGIAAVELSGGGQTLNLLEGSPALLKFPVHADLQANAPNQISLWRFDEVIGLWIHEGFAELNGAYYEASVPHFSFWCIGEEVESVELTGIIADENDNPISAIPVSLFHPDFGYLGSVFTASNGVFTGLAPAGISLTLSVASQCNITIVNQEISPLSSDTDLGIINISGGQSSTTMISGSLQNCDGDAVSSGIIYVCWDGDCQTILAENDGSFSQSFVHCADDEFQILVIDYNSGQTIILTEDVASSINMSAVVVCQTQLDTYISLSFSGTERFYPFPFQYIQSGRPHLKSEDNDYSILLSFDQATVGSYSNELASIIYFENSSTPEISLFTESGSCSWGECTDFNITVTEYGEVGGYIEGTYSGTLDMYNTMMAMPGEPISGSFRVIRLN